MIDKILFEKTLSPLERWLLCCFFREPTLLQGSQSQMASRLGVSERHISAAMARFREMRIFRRSLETKALVLNDPSQWFMISR